MQGGTRILLDRGNAEFSDQPEAEQSWPEGHLFTSHGFRLRLHQQFHSHHHLSLCLSKYGEDGHPDFRKNFTFCSGLKWLMHQSC